MLDNSPAIVPSGWRENCGAEAGAQVRIWNTVSWLRGGGDVDFGCAR
jgi:hypothetical protein